MSNEIKQNYPSGTTAYAIIFNWDLQPWNTAGTPAFENWTDGNITDYDITITYVGGSFYKANFPPTIPAGRYIIATYVLDGTPTITDTPLGSEVITWDGTAETFIGNSSGRIDLGSILGTGLSGKVDDNFNTFFQNAGSDTSAVVDDVRSAASGYPRFL